MTYDFRPEREPRDLGGDAAVLIVAVACLAFGLVIVSLWP